MTLFHCVGTFLLAFCPHIVYFYATPLHESDALPALFKGAVSYLGAAGTKLVLLATFLPNSDVLDQDQVDYIEEGLKALINLVDVAFVFLALRYLTHRSLAASARYQCLGLGWAAADSVLRRGVPLYIEAMSAEFTWAPLRSALASNLQLVQAVCTFALCHLLFCRKHRPAGADVVLWTLVGLGAATQSIAAVSHGAAPTALVAQLGSWTATATEASATSLLALGALAMHGQVVGS